MCPCPSNCAISVHFFTCPSVRPREPLNET
jgi:hypothetical protein